MKVSGYTSSNASATSNVFLLNKVTSEFFKGDIVTFGDSKKEYEIREAKAICFSNLIPCPIVLYKGTEFKITQRPFSLTLSGDGNIQGIVLKKAVGFIISPGMRVRSVVR